MAKPWDEIMNHIIKDEKPSFFIEQCSSEPYFREYPFYMLLNLKKTKQSPKHHPEGNVWVHTMMVLDEAAKRKKSSKDPKVFMCAALLHDIGKYDTTKVRKGRITSYDHDKKGADLAFKFLSALECDKYFIRDVVCLVRWHMQVLFVVKGMSLADIEAIKAECNIEEIALLSLCDRLGRLDVDQKKELESVEKFLELCGRKGIAHVSG